MGKASSTLGSFFSNVKKKSGEILTYFTGANMVYKTVAQIKQGITYVREIDAALTELKKLLTKLMKLIRDSYKMRLKLLGRSALPLKILLMLQQISQGLINRPLYGDI